jgi:drug/metabolite transporter (DMT)-like permease
MLLALAALWGASFLFIKVAVRELTPATLIVGRLGLEALTLALLVPFVVGTGEMMRQLRANAGWLIVVALVNTAIPFWLLSWGETRIDSGLASIIQASVPIFNALIAFVAFREVRVTGVRLLGVAVGFAGVALLVSAAGGQGAQGPRRRRDGVLLRRRRPAHWPVPGDARPFVVALASTVIATLVWLPVGVAKRRPMPGWKTIGSVVMLGVQDCLATCCSSA